MISKELLSEMLGDAIYYFEINDTELSFESLISDGARITYNIYELAHKCKEWAFKQDKTILSGIENRFGSALIKRDSNDEYIKEFSADTEPEAIFKACEWIREQKSK